MAPKRAMGHLSGGITGYYQSMSVDKAGDTEECPDNMGNVAAATNFNAITDITLDVITGATAQPTLFSTVAVTAATSDPDSAQISGNYSLRKLGFKYGNRTYKALSATLKRYNTNGIPA